MTFTFAKDGTFYVVRDQNLPSKRYIVRAGLQSLLFDIETMLALPRPSTYANSLEAPFPG